MSEFPLLPKPVVAAMAGKVLHVECLQDPEKCCERCTTVILEAFDGVYGDLPDEGRVLAAILDDMMREGRRL